jgi:hypothetical protein
MVIVKFDLFTVDILKIVAINLKNLVIGNDGYLKWQMTRLFELK